MRTFNPDTAGTVNINVSAASQSVQVFQECGPVDVVVVNDGTATVWVTHGNSSVAASLTTSYPIRAGETRLIRMENPDRSSLYVAAIAAGATGKIYFTPGRGETH